MATKLEVIGEIVDRVFDENMEAFEASLLRLRLQADLVQINSKIANVQAKAEQIATEVGVELAELEIIKQQKQAEIDALESK